MIFCTHIVNFCRPGHIFTGKYCLPEREDSGVDWKSGISANWYAKQVETMYQPKYEEYGAEFKVAQVAHIALDSVLDTDIM